jgi:glycosyltransferase involved in cell wall biosynthesis
MSPQLTLIIPAYNEEKNIPLVIPEIISFCKNHDYKLIIVNDGSTDNSKESLGQLTTHTCLTVIDHKINRGYGGALKTGVLACDTEYLVTLDCDGQHIVENINTLLQQIIIHDADMMVGSRRGLKSHSVFRGIGKGLIRFTIKQLMPLPIYDINSGMKMYKTELGKKYCKICPNSMAYSDVICLTFINQFHKVMEVPININRRKMGKSTINIKTAFRTVYEVFNIIILFNPIRIFLPIALTAISMGLLWGIPIALRGNGVSTGSMLSIMLGVLTLFFTAIAEQLSQIRKKDL